jgi:hypothetical protein
MSSDKAVETVSADIAAAIEAADKKSKAVEAMDWATILTADDAFKALQAAGIQVTNASDYGDGFRLIEDKDKGKLVGIPFICVNARIANGTFGDFSILHVITKHNDKYLLIDGSTGIHKQVQNHGRAVFVGLMCEQGLTVSEYDYLDEKSGELRPAKTYYIAGMK